MEDFELKIQDKLLKKFPGKLLKEVLGELIMEFSKKFLNVLKEIPGVSSKWILKESLEYLLMVFLEKHSMKYR